MLWWKKQMHFYSYRPVQITYTYLSNPTHKLYNSLLWKQLLVHAIVQWLVQASSWRPRFYPRVAHVGLVVEKGQWERLLLQVLQCSPINNHSTNAPYSFLSHLVGKTMEAWAATIPQRHSHALHMRIFCLSISVFFSLWIMYSFMC